MDDDDGTVAVESRRTGEINYYRRPAGEVLALEEIEALNELRIDDYNPDDWEPVGNAILFRQIQNGTTMGGLIYTQDQDEAIMAQVVKVGPGRTSEYGFQEPLEVERGDIVLLRQGCAFPMLNLSYTGRNRNGYMLGQMRDVMLKTDKRPMLCLPKKATGA
jgi:co-chaperonin GroES (HSP10)